MSVKAMKLALEALVFMPNEVIQQKGVRDAITALRRAILDDKPVARVIDWGVEGPRLQGLTNDWPEVGTLLYTQPQQKETE